MIAASYIATGIYIAGFLGMLVLNFTEDLVSPTLGFVRALLWPIYLVFGWPKLLPLE